MKTLIVAEKPSVAVAIAGCSRKIIGDFYFKGKLLTAEYVEKNEAVLKKEVKSAGKLENDKYIISFAEGHLVKLFDAYDYNAAYKNWRSIPFPFIPSEFKTKVTKDRLDLYNNLEKLMNSKDVNEIYCATDGDREGENIFALIYAKSQCKKPVKRLWFDSPNEEYLTKAFKDIKDASHYESLRTAGYCRMVSDWLLGSLMTAKTTIKLGSGKEILNVGRVQTAVLSEIVNIEDIIKNFSKKKFYQVNAKFKTKDGKVYEGIYDEKFDDPLKADNFIKSLKKNGKVNEYNEKLERRYSDSLYSQTALQVDIYSSFGLNPDATLDASQFLYEKGYATYPRTASRYITSGDADAFMRMYYEIASVNALATKAKFSKTNNKIVDDSKVDGHSAIIPTSTVPDLDKLTKEQRIVYEALVRRAISVNFPPAIDQKQNVETDISGFIFKSAGKKEIDRGWREVYNTQVKDTSIPKLTKGENVEVISLSKKEVETQPPKRYNRGSLLQFMETCGKKIESEEARELMKNKGIGTGATRANIISSLFQNGYVEEKKNTIYPTQKGIDLVHKFPVAELKSAEFTGNMEFKLYKVEKGEMSREEYMKDITDLYILSCNKLDNKEIGKIGGSKDAICKCPKCKEGYIVKKKGKNGDFYGCTCWQKGCKFSISDVRGKTLTEKQVQTLIEKGSTGKMKGFKKKDGTELPSAKVILKKDFTTELDFNC